MQSVASRISVTCPNLTFHPLHNKVTTQPRRVAREVKSSYRIVDSKGLEGSGPTGYARCECCLKSTFTCSYKKCFLFAECRPGFFKAAASGDKCEPCPANSEQLDSGALVCPCTDGFYRAPTDPPTGPCSGNECHRSPMRTVQ